MQYPSHASQQSRPRRQITFYGRNALVLSDVRAASSVDTLLNGGTVPSGDLSDDDAASATAYAQHGLCYVCCDVMLFWLVRLLCFMFQATPDIYSTPNLVRVICLECL